MCSGWRANCRVWPSMTRAKFCARCTGGRDVGAALSRQHTNTGSSACVGASAHLGGHVALAFVLDVPLEQREKTGLVAVERHDLHVGLQQARREANIDRRLLFVAGEDPQFDTRLIRRNGGVYDGGAV